MLVSSIETLVKEHQLDLDVPYLVGVSGGRDSVALLHGLKEAGFSCLHVAHLNHGLRGEESDLDQAFVRGLADALECPFHTATVDLSTSAVGMEESARLARYAFFAEQTAELGTQGVFLGHHADDQAETVLFNLLRGSAQLQGMAAVSQREINGQQLTLLRPLLEVSRTHIDAYLSLHESSLSYREDSTNSQPIAVRNRIRHELIPLANEILGREVSPLVCRAHERAALDQSYIDEQWSLGDFLDPQGRIFLPALEVAHPAIQSRVIKSYLESHQVGQISSSLIGNVLELLGNESLAKVNLPGGRFIRRKEKRLFIQ